MPTVALDAVANLGTANTTAGLSASFTLGSSATALCVAVGGVRGSTSYTALTTHTVAVGATPMVLLKIINCANTAGDGWVELWGLIGPPTGAQTITVVENKSTSASSINVTAISFTGVSQFGTAVPNYGTGSTTTSGGVVSSTGSRVFSVAAGLDATFTTPSGTLRSNQPATANPSYVTLLLQDQAGAATVTQTAHFSGPSGWGVISVNLVAGNLFRVSAPLSLTASRAAAGSFVGRVYTVGASLAMTTTATAAGVDQPLGPPLRYVGRPPDSSAVVGTSAYAQVADAANLVTPSWLAGRVTAAAQNLVTPAWVAERAAGYVAQTTVDSVLGGFVADSALGAHSGVAQADGTGIVPSAQLPTLTTDNVAKVYDCTSAGTVFLPTGTTYTTVTDNIGEFVIANVEVPNPGYPWIALPFAYVLGHSSAAASGSRLLGNGNVGFLAVTAPGQTTPVYGMGLCTADTIPNYYPVVPATNGLAQVTPLTQPPFEGGATLQLSACNFAGTNYTFSGTGLVFYVLVLPALGGGS